MSDAVICIWVNLWYMRVWEEYGKMLQQKKRATQPLRGEWQLRLQTADMTVLGLTLKCLFNLIQILKWPEDPLVQCKSENQEG